MVEFENVVNIGFSNDHNNLGAGSLWNGVTDRPVIADPPITEINQVYLDWKPLDSLPLRGGRQEIIIDNARFIGNVGWRQNHQTFDGATAHFTGVKNLDLGYAYIARQRTVTGASRPMSTVTPRGCLHLFRHRLAARLSAVHRLRPGGSVALVDHHLRRLLLRQGRSLDDARSHLPSRARDPAGHRRQSRYRSKPTTCERISGSRSAR